MSCFDANGRCIPGAESRVFSEKDYGYYIIEPLHLDYEKILLRLKEVGFAPATFDVNVFKEQATSLINIVREDKNYSDILNGVCVPFVYQDLSEEKDLGKKFEKYLLPAVKRTFLEQYPESHFKAVLQGDTALEGQIRLDVDSNQDQFVQSTGQPTVGLYFPQALQGFDVRSQRMHMKTLPELKGARRCLSGGTDVCAALVGSPNLLISDKNYSPILCMSGYVHNDPRLVLLMKSYGPHLEFWCMSQMLTPAVTQVSEQWSGGVTIF